jgi:hypothetical protein
MESTRGLLTQGWDVGGAAHATHRPHGGETTPARNSSSQVAQPPGNVFCNAPRVSRWSPMSPAQLNSMIRARFLSSLSLRFSLTVRGRRNLTDGLADGERRVTVYTQGWVRVQRIPVWLRARISPESARGLLRPSRGRGWRGRCRSGPTEQRARAAEGRSDEGGPHGSDWREGEAKPGRPTGNSAQVGIGEPLFFSFINFLLCF